MLSWGLGTRTCGQWGLALAGRRGSRWVSTGGVEPADRLEHGEDGVGHVSKVDGAELVGGMVVVLMEAEAGDGVGDHTLQRKGVVVGSAEELLFRVRILGEVGTVLCELGAEIGAFKAG